MSMREIIYNIEELEEITNKTVDPEILLDLLHKCPIELSIPLTLKIHTDQVRSVPEKHPDERENRG